MRTFENNSTVKADGSMDASEFARATIARGAWSARLCVMLVLVASCGGGCISNHHIRTGQAVESVLNQTFELNRDCLFFTGAFLYPAGSPLMPKTVAEYEAKGERIVVKGQRLRIISIDYEDCEMGEYTANAVLIGGKYDGLKVEARGLIDTPNSPAEPFGVSYRNREQIMKQLPGRFAPGPALMRVSAGA